MHNLVLFCKSFIDDLDRLEILKKSVDKYNADKIPFYIVVPQKDLELIKNRIVTNKEDYEINFISDEQILNLNVNCPQSWRNQQIVKLCFWKAKVCNFYSIIDSDCYFIKDFLISDFMLDENNPYLFMGEILPEIEERRFVKDYFKRSGRTYDFIKHGQPFSCKVLEDMENNFLNPSGFTWQKLIDLHPYEFQWHGEWFLKSNLHKFAYSRSRFKSFWKQKNYLESKNRGETEEDFANKGYIAILMQNKFVKDKVYKPSRLAKVYKYRERCIQDYFNRQDEKITGNKRNV